jgi:hypothetical protein
MRNVHYSLSFLANRPRFIISTGKDIILQALYRICLLCFVAMLIVPYFSQVVISYPFLNLARLLIRLCGAQVFLFYLSYSY